MAARLAEGTSKERARLGGWFLGRLAKRSLANVVVRRCLGEFGGLRARREEKFRGRDVIQGGLRVGSVGPLRTVACGKWKEPRLLLLCCW